MPSSEELAQYVASLSPNLVQEEQQKGQGYLVPPVPKPGEIIICQQCGKPMYPKDFSKDPKIRKHEFKWHIHWDCEQEIWNMVDRQTPGLLAERKENGGIPRGSKAAMHLGKPNNQN